MESYRQSIPAIELSLECHTRAVPQDGYYYVLMKGQIEGRFRTMKQALTKYRELLDASGYAPPPKDQETRDSPPQEVERYMDQLEGYWTESHKHSRRGGKTMYRG